MGRTPRVFERGEPYAIAALLVVLGFLAGDRLGVDRSISTTARAVSGLVLKLLAVRFRVEAS